MKYLSAKFLYMVLLTMSSAAFIHAQVAISTDQSAPDASAMLHIKSMDKGLLIPRMNTTERTAILSPAQGLLVYDTDEDRFFYAYGGSWYSLAKDDPIFEYISTDNLVRAGLVTEHLPDFVFGSPSLGDSGLSDFDQRFFFDKSKAAFRAGDVKDDSWDDSNVGEFSVAFGKDTRASGKAAFAMGGMALALGDYSFAAGDGVTALFNFSVAMGEGAASNNFAAVSIGDRTNANGLGSLALGRRNTAHSYLETVLGGFATNYTPNSTLFYDANDRLFTIGNGTNGSNRSDAMRILKNGNTWINGALTINDAYTFPVEDGSEGHVLMTDGSGTVSWNPIDRTFLEDNDTDTKIQVEESADEDKIRFDVAGAEIIRVEKNASGPGRIAFSTPSVLLGNEAGFLTVGDFNTMVGNQAGRQNYTGNSNVFIGDESGRNNGTGNNNVYIGRQAGYTNISGNGNLLIGHNAGYSESGSNKLYIENSNSPTPLIYGEFDNDLVRINGTLDINDAFTFPSADGSDGQVLITDGSGNVNWTSLPNTTFQDLSLSGNTLSITEDATPVDLSGFLDNTDNQDLSLTGNTLSLTNDVTTVDLSGFLDNTDNQDLTLTGNILSLTNDNTTVDLSDYLDNTDSQSLSLTGDNLNLTNGGSVDLSGYTNTDNQDLELTGNTLSLTNDGTNVDLSPYLDNTDAQSLSLIGDNLSLANGGSVDLSGYTNTDNQDLSLNGNVLSLTNDGTTVDLSSFLDNTDNQDLSLIGNNLFISGGNFVDLTPFTTNTNIYTNDGMIPAERTLNFSGNDQFLTLKRSDNNNFLGLTFKNSGTFYASSITTPAIGDGNDYGLDFRTKGNDINLGTIGKTMRLTNNGTVTLPEYGQGNVTGTPAKMLAVSSNGGVIEVDIPEEEDHTARIVHTFDQTEQNNNGGSVSGWLRVSDYTPGMSVTSGEVIHVSITFSAEIQGGSGNDELRFRVLANGVGCSDITGGVTDHLEVYREVRDHSIQTAIQHTFSVNCTGTYQFALETDFASTDDNVAIDDVQITAVKY